MVSTVTRRPSASYVSAVVRSVHCPSHSRRVTVPPLRIRVVVVVWHANPERPLV